MELTRERKILLGAVALAAGAFLVDQVMFGAGPDDAEAGVAVVRSVPRTVRPQPAAAIAASPAPQSESSLAQRLEEAAGAQAMSVGLPDLVDAFVAPESWAPPEQRPQNNQAALSGQEFAQRHKLDAIMHGSGGGFALVNGKAVKPGQKLDGFELVELGQRSATFRGPAGVVELQIAANLGNQ